MGGAPLLRAVMASPAGVDRGCTPVQPRRTSAGSARRRLLPNAASARPYFVVSIQRFRDLKTCQPRERTQKVAVNVTVRPVR